MDETISERTRRQVDPDPHGPPPSDQALDFLQDLPPCKGTKKLALLIAGMHRSGTSAMARVLGLLGCDLPKTLLGAGRGNELGHWESRRIMVLNNKLLASAGSRWDDWEAFNPGWYHSPVRDEFLEQAALMLGEEFGRSRLFVLKDPRICRLLPFWIQAIESFDATPLIISPVRNPYDVAASLASRDGFDISVGLLLWLRHVLDAEADSRGLPRAFVRYEELLAQWQPIPERLASTFALSWPRRSTSVDMEIERFLSPTHRHHAAADARVLNDPSLTHWIAPTFTILDRWTRGDSRASDLDDLDRIKKAFDEAVPTFSRSVLVGRQAAHKVGVLDRELAAANEKGSALEARVGTLDSELRTRTDRIGKLEADLAGRANALADAQGLIATRASELEQRNRKIAELDALAKERAAELQAKVDRIRELDAALATSEGVLAETRAQAQGIETALAGREAELQSRDARVSELESALQAHTTALTDAQGLVATRAAELQQRDQRIAELEKLAAERAAELQAKVDRIHELEATLATSENALAETRVRIQGLEAALGGREAELQLRDARVTELEGALQARATVLADAEALADTRLSELEQRDQEIAELTERAAEFNRSVEEKDQEIDRLRQAMVDLRATVAEANAARDSASSGRNEALVARNHAITELEKARTAANAVESAKAAAEKAATEAKRRADALSLDVAKLKAKVDERFREVAEVTRMLVDRNNEVERLSTQITGYRDRLDEMTNRASWRITAPLRSLADRLGGKRTRDRRMIEQSGLFDAAWYLEKNPDVKAAEVEPLDHYLRYGAKEGRDPSERFSTSAYLAAHQDVAAAGINALVHYVYYGRIEGRAIQASR